MYRTKDFYLSATLVLNGYKIKHHEKDVGKTIFYFEDSDKLRTMVDDYFYDRLKVSPHQFQSAIKTIKALMFD